MQFHTIVIVLCTFLLCVHVNSSNSLCPYRGGARPYYFGTTGLRCLSSKRGKRDAPQRSTWDLTHRFIFYKGTYFEFFDDSTVITGDHSAYCEGSLENSPAGYSKLSLDCIKSCASRYTAEFGLYDFLYNNCHSFANTLSTVLCTTDSRCPSWCNT